MLFRTRLKAGLMLYALLMVSLFSLLLQFYLNRQVATTHTHKASQQSLTAYAMATWTKEEVQVSLDKEKAADKAVASSSQTDSTNTETSQPEKTSAETVSTSVAQPLPNKAEVDAKATTGDFRYDKGQSHYQLDGEELTVDVQLTSGPSFHYVFFVNGQTP